MGPLKNIHAVVDCIGGRIDLALARSDDRFRLTLQSPGGKTALVCLPVAMRLRPHLKVNGKSLWDGDKFRASVAGLTFSGADADYARFTVPPGVWNFEAE